MSLLVVGGNRLVCADAGTSPQAIIFGEFDIARVSKVTARKQTPDVLVFYFHEDRADSDEAAPLDPKMAEPSMVLQFTHGAEAVMAFIRALRGTYSVLPADARPSLAGAGGAGHQAPADEE